MKNAKIAIWAMVVTVVLILFGPLGQESRGDFVLYNDEQLTVNSPHNNGTLYDMSRAFIVSDGNVSNLYDYNSSTVNISGGVVDWLYAYDSSKTNISGGRINKELYANNSSTVNISDGSVWYLDANNSSKVNISGGSVYYHFTRGTSTANISGGNMWTLTAYEAGVLNISGGNVTIYLTADHSSKVNISGGSMSYLVAYGSSVTNISDGFIARLAAYDSSTVTFHGENFLADGFLTFDGNRVLGTGTLFGEWMDGTRWAVSITSNSPTATILAIPEPKPNCKGTVPGDVNNDCKVDFADLAIMASHWVECNLDPPSACW